MAFSITMTVNADGTISVIAADRFQGSSYYVASKHGGDMKEVDTLTARTRVRRGLSVRQDLGWNSVSDHLRDAAVALMLCLPPAEDFDEDGRPIA